jgi:hypothetical protein
MDLEFSVELIPGKRVSGPQLSWRRISWRWDWDGSIEDAFRDATSNRAQLAGGGV